MSHRDQDGHIAGGENAQDLHTIFQWLLGGMSCAGIAWRPNCSCSPQGLILTGLLWAWSDEAALTRRFSRALKIAYTLSPEGVPRKLSYQAFLKLLVKWTPLLIGLLVESLRERMKTSLKARFLCQGFALFGVDGSRIALPRTESNEERFSPDAAKKKKAARKRNSSRNNTGEKKRGSKRRKKRNRNAKNRRRPRSAAARTSQSRQKKADSPQMWITTMWHAGTGLPWDWRSGPSDSSERAHLLEMLDDLPPEAMVTADAGFVGFDYWKAIIDSDREFLIRVGGNVKLIKHLGYARESGQTVYLWPDREAKRHQPPLVLRLVVVHDGRAPCYLVTSVHRSCRLSDRQIADMYALRWGIELYYRHFKQTFGRHKLRSHKAEHAECELAWSFVGLWAMLLHAACHLHRHHIAPERLSVAQALYAYRTTIREYKSDPDPGESLWDLLTIALIDDYARRNKQSRNHPRKKYRTATAPPEITLATPEQTQLAQEISDQADAKRLTA